MQSLGHEKLGEKRGVGGQEHPCKHCDLKLIEGPEGAKWELAFACFCSGKMGFQSLGLGFESEKKLRWEWD